MLKDIFNKLQQYPLPDVVHFFIIPALAIWIAIFIPLTITLNVASSVLPTKTITSITLDPAPANPPEVPSVPVDTPNGVKLIINGTGFENVDNAAIAEPIGPNDFNGYISLGTTFISATQLKATIHQSHLRFPGDFPIKVMRNNSSEISSNPAYINVAPIVIRSISPKSVLLPATQGIELIVNGTGFIDGSKVNIWGDGAVNTYDAAFESDATGTRLKATIPITFFDSINDLDLRKARIHVHNGSGGTYSNIMEFDLKRTLLTIKKNAIGSTSAVNFGYFISGPTTLRLDVVADTIVPRVSGYDRIEVKPGTYSITENPRDGWTFGPTNCDKAFQRTGTFDNPKVEIEIIAGETTTCTFTNTKINPDLTISKITPNEITVGSPDTIVTIEGTKFKSDSYAEIQQEFTNNLPFRKRLTTEFISATRLKAQIPENWLSASGILVLYVFNPVLGDTEEKSNAVIIRVVDELNTEKK